MITEGWMWLDATAKKTAEERLAGAINAYKQRFGRLPRTVLVSEEQFQDGPFDFGTTRVIPVCNISIHLFLLSNEVAGGDGGKRGAR